MVADDSETGRVVPGSYRPAKPVRAVWVTNYGEEVRPGLLIGWRQQYLPSVADHRPYWFGRVVMVRVYGEDYDYVTKWVWDPYIVAVPSEPDDLSAARQRAEAERRARAGRSVRPSSVRA